MRLNEKLHDVWVNDNYHETYKQYLELEEDLKVLDILKRLFHESYYDLDNRVCVDGEISATKEEIELIKEWLEK